MRKLDMESGSHVHFSSQEFADRRCRLDHYMDRARVDGMLLFRQESMYWLTGYDSFGYVFFQCLYVGRNGQLTLLTRQPDLRVARYTSYIDDIRVWRDATNANPASDLKRILEGLNCRGQRLGVEWGAYGLSAYYGKLLEESFDGFCDLVDANLEISSLRLVKSPAELRYIQKAAELADQALQRVVEIAHVGTFEGDLYAELQSLILKNGGDYPANANIVGSGPGAFMGRYFSGRRCIGESDLLLVELAGVYRHYHAAIMRVFQIGGYNSSQDCLHRAGVDALADCRNAFVPGRTLGDVFNAFKVSVSRSEYLKDNIAFSLPFSIGYGVGATFSPNWMDYPHIHEGSDITIEKGMTFFIHLSLRDDDRGITAAPGETIVVGDKGAERLSKLSFDIVL